MAISEKKMKIVIENYFRQECNVDTSIRSAFEKGFRIGVQKGQSVKQKNGKWLLDTVYPSGVKKFRCSICGYDRTVHERYEGVFRLNFCPNCGADMREEDNPELLRGETQ